MIKELYEKIAELDITQQKRFSRTARMLLKTYRGHFWAFLIETVDNGVMAMELFRVLGYGNDQLTIDYQGTRWADSETREVQLSNWQEKLDFEITPQEQKYGKAELTGCIKISFKTQKFNAVTITNNKSSESAFINFLAILASHF